MRFFAILVIILIAVGGTQAAAQSEKGQAQTGGDLRSAVQNPIRSLISLPFKFTFD